MDFFEYAGFADMFTEYQGSTLWLSFLIGGLCFAIVYVFQSVGLFTIATRGGFKNKWMAFVPFLNTYYLGVCAEKNRFMSIKAKIVGIVAASLEVALFTLYVIYYVSLGIVRPYIELLDTEEVYLWGNTPVIFENYGLPAEFGSVHPAIAWAGWCYNNLQSYVISWLDIIYQITLIGLLICFFQTYSPRHYLLFTITSLLFPVQGILIFCVRNNKGVSYPEYIRRVQEINYMQYRNQTYYNPYDNPGNPGNRPPYNGAPPKSGAPKNDGQSDPFSEYGQNSSQGSNPDDPFDEFKN